MAVKKALLATKVAVLLVVLLAMASIANAQDGSHLYTLLASLKQPSLPQDVRNYYKIERASRDMIINKAEKRLAEVKSMEELAAMLNTALEGIIGDNGGKYALGKCPPDCINCGCASAPFVIICKCGLPADA